MREGPTFSQNGAVPGRTPLVAAAVLLLLFLGLIARNAAAWAVAISGSAALLVLLQLFVGAGCLGSSELIAHRRERGALGGGALRALLALAIPALCGAQNARVRVVRTLAGSGVAAYADGSGASASFDGPALAVDAGGNVVVADGNNCRIRRVTPSGAVSTLAGSGGSAFIDGTGTAASFGSPSAVAVDAGGNALIGDFNIVRKVTPGGVVTTLAGGEAGSNGFADGTGTGALFSYLTGAAIDAGGDIFFADRDNRRIRKVTPGGVVSTLAGGAGYSSVDGTGTGASFDQPHGVAIDTSGNLFVSDDSLIRKVTPGGVVTTFSTPFSSYLAGLAVDASGNVLFADYYTHLIRKISPGGVVSTFAGDGFGDGSNFGRWRDGTDKDASFNYPYGVAADSSGNVFVADIGNRIRVISNSTCPQGYFCSNGLFPCPPLSYCPPGSFAPTPCPATPGLAALWSSLSTAPDCLFNASTAAAQYVATTTTLAGAFAASTFSDSTVGVGARFVNPLSVAVASTGALLVADSGAHRIRAVLPSGATSTLAGSGSAAFSNGAGTAASFNTPSGVAVNASDFAIIADTHNHCIVR
jgi:hypothetical protein